MTSRLFRAYCRLVLRHPLFWLAAVGALCAVAAWHRPSIPQIELPRRASACRNFAKMVVLPMPNGTRR